tara:strand:+ start:2893 stop:3345 length:453 start_codon:yes stop_codon:yes gene_type:complete
MVSMTKPSNESMIYTTLRDECGFTHEMIKACVKYMPSPRWRDIFKTEKRKLKSGAEPIINGLAIMCLREEPKMAANAIMKQTEGLSYAITMFVATDVMNAMEYRKSSRQKVWNVLRSKKMKERRYGLKEWKSRGLRTYLQFKRLLPPDQI